MKKFYNYSAIGEFSPVLLSELIDFEDRHRRKNFISRMTLKRPALIIKRSFGNFLGSLVWIIAIPTERPDNYEQRIVAIHSNLVANIASYYTRAIRKVFKERFSYLMDINTPRTSLSEVMYSLATGDSSAACSKAVQKRRDRIWKLAQDMDDPDAVGDLRYCNGSVADDAFQLFWKYLQSVLHNYQVAQERRHGEVGYFPTAMSIADLIHLVRDECRRSEEIPVDKLRIPSKTTIAYSFVPSDSYSLSARRYKGRFPVIRTVMSRTARASHPDAHYGRAAQRYLREFVIFLNKKLISRGFPQDSVVFISQDDKCLILVGEPGLAIVSGFVITIFILVPKNLTWFSLL